MKESDKYLLKTYMKGFNDTFDNKNNSSFYNRKKLKAYNLGWQHSIIGDELSHIDLLTNEEILKLIKSG